jgi:two-component system LytT family response regulator
MNKLKCLIVDDEPLARDGLADYVRQIPFAEVGGSCRNAMEALNLLQEGPIDLMFLDINMPVMSGVDFIKSLSRPPAFIFTTAYREFALDAFELNAVDYLVKPISFQRFLTAIEKVRERLETPDHSNQPTQNTGFFIKQDGQFLRILFDDILYIEGMKDYLFIYTRGKRYMALISMKTAEELLPADRFLRVHRSYIVALLHVDAIESHTVHLGTHEIPIGKTQRDVIFERIVGNTLWKRKPS